MNDSTALWRDPLVWWALVLAALVLGMPSLRPIFAALFPSLERPVYELDSFADLAIAHLMLVTVSSSTAVIIGVAAGILVTRPFGATFRGLVTTIVAAGQTVPPVAVLAIAVPVIGFGFEPALIALVLYGLLPVVANTLAGLDAVPSAAVEAARGIGMGEADILRRVELPLALPVIIAGIRSSVIINIGTAAIASTVGARTLGSPLIVGLNGANTAYVIQGAVLIALMAVVVDLGFERILRVIQRWRRQ